MTEVNLKVRCKQCTWHEEHRVFLRNRRTSKELGVPASHVHIRLQLFLSAA